MDQRIVSFFGLLLMLLIAWCFSENKKNINYRIVVGGVALQFLLAIFILHSSIGRQIFEVLTRCVSSIVAMSDEGARFVFGEKFYEHLYAFKVLPTIIFMSSISYILFYLGVIQKIVSFLSWVMVKAMNISGTESLVTAANVFLGQTEAPLFIKPYLQTMTRSEILTMMTGGMATVAGGILAAYIGMGIPPHHLLAASVISAPAAIVLSKIICPESKSSKIKNEVKIAYQMQEVNIFEAACSGASSGLNLALNVGAMLITFIALISLINHSLDLFTPYLGYKFTLENILGTVFRPIAFCMGIAWQESAIVGRLLGEKVVMNEFVAYVHLLELMKEGALSQRAIIVSTYALCGFANFSSIAIQIGGIGALEPKRKKDFALLGLRALLGATLTGFMTACLAGIVISS